MATKKQMIDTVIARLSTIESINPNYPGVMTTGKNSFREFAENELPLVRVMFEEGNAEFFNNAIEYRHTDSLMVDYVLSGNDDEMDDALYAAEEAISNYLINDHNSPEDEESIYHIFDTFEYQGWKINFEKGEVSIGAVRLRFQVKYSTKHVKTYDDLNTANVKVKLENADPNTPIIAEDDIDLSDG